MIESWVWNPLEPKHHAKRLTDLEIRIEDVDQAIAVQEASIEIIVRHIVPRTSAAKAQR